MLVILRIDIRRDMRSVGARLAIGGNIDLQDSSEPDLELDATVLIEIIVPDVFCKDFSIVD